MNIEDERTMRAHAAPVHPVERAKVMFVSDPVWKKIREQFTEEEKTTMRTALCGQVICPPGVMVDEDKLPPDLAEKLTQAIKPQKTVRARKR